MINKKLGGFEEDISRDARHYTNLRRRLWKLTLTMLVLFVWIRVFGFFGEWYNSDALRLLGLLMMLIFFVCLVADMLICSLLNYFRCPRRTKRFTVTWWGNWFGKACNHCGLDLG